MANQFFSVEAEHASQRGIGLQNAALEIANADTDRSGFKKVKEEKIAGEIASGRNLGHDVHADINPQRSARRPTDRLRPGESREWLAGGSHSKLGKGALSFSANGPR
jgi:hypothetical protein